MLSTKTWALLTQSLFISMVGAERMKVADELAAGLKKGTAADNMQAIFKDKNNAICGGQEVRNELTKGTTVGGMRTTNWDKVIEIANAYLDDVEIEIPILTKAVQELEKRLALAGEDDAFTDKSAEDIIPLIMKTISKPNTFIAQKEAKASGCGFSPKEVNTREVKDENRKRAREARKTGAQPDLLPILDAECFKNGIDEWNTNLADFLSAGKVRANSDNTWQACCEVLDCGEDASVDLAKSYCDEWCTRIAQNPALNAVEYLGGKTKELKAELDKKSAELAYMVSEKKECEGAKMALTEFQKQMDALNGDIDDAFKKHKSANDAVDAAESGLDKLSETQGELTEKLDGLQNKLAEKVKIEEGLKAEVAAIKEQEPLMQASVAAAIGAFDVAASQLDDAMGALTNFNKLKVLVGATVAKMWAYFNAGVLEHMNQLGMEKETRLKEYFTEDYKNHEVYTPFLKGMKSLSEYCEKTAVPAFKRVEDPEDFPLQTTLNAMCEYEPYPEATAEFGDEVMEIKSKMLASLEKAQTWHDPTHGHPEYTADYLKDLATHGEITLLREVENAFSPSEYYTNYLTHWKKDGQFLGLLKQLETVEANLKSVTEQLRQKVESLKKALSDLMAKKKSTMTALQEAIKATQGTQNEVDLATGEEQTLEAQIKEAEVNLDELYNLLQAAEDAYAAAKAAFAEAHKKGTNLGF